MPRGKWTSHKGRSRHFTNPEELEEERKRKEKEREWRKARGDSSSEDEDGEGAGSSKARPPPKSDDESDESEDESEDEENVKGKGVEKLIEISNPNREQKKTKKLSTLNETLDNAKPELSRKEREELERQQAAARYQKLHAEGKTGEAQADLARLAIVKQQREEAAKKREAERLQKEAGLKEKAANRDKALGKKS